MIFWPAKEPGETLDYVFDWTDRLTLGETISSFTVTATGASVTSSRTGAIVTAFLSAGTAGTVAKIVNTITTNMGRTDVETAIVPIGGGPVDMETARAHLKLEPGEGPDDAIVETYLAAAVSAIEDTTGRFLTNRIATYTGRSFYRALRLPKLPVQSILSFQYDDTSGADTALTGYRIVSAERGEVLPAIGATWPSFGCSPSAIRVSYVAGYNPEDVPRPLIQAVLLMLGHFYANREAVTIGSGNAPATLPWAVDALIAPYRAPGIA